MSLKAETYRMSSPSKEYVCVCVCVCVFGGRDLLAQRTSCLGGPGPGWDPPVHTPMCNWNKSFLKQYLTMCEVLWHNFYSVFHFLKMLVTTCCVHFSEAKSSELWFEKPWSVLHVQLLPQLSCFLSIWSVCSHISGMLVEFVIVISNFHSCPLPMKDEREKKELLFFWKLSWICGKDSGKTTHLETKPLKLDYLSPVSIHACLPVPVPGTYIMGIDRIAYICRALTCVC